MLNCNFKVSKLIFSWSKSCATLDQEALLAHYDKSQIFVLKFHILTAFHYIIDYLGFLSLRLDQAAEMQNKKEKIVFDCLNEMNSLFTSDKKLEYLKLQECKQTDSDVWQNNPHRKQY